MTTSSLPAAYTPVPCKLPLSSFQNAPERAGLLPCSVLHLTTEGRKFCPDLGKCIPSSLLQNMPFLLEQCFVFTRLSRAAAPECASGSPAAAQPEPVKESQASLARQPRVPPPLRQHPAQRVSGVMRVRSSVLQAMVPKSKQTLLHSFPRLCFPARSSRGGTLCYSHSALKVVPCVL